MAEKVEYSENYRLHCWTKKESFKNLNDIKCFRSFILP